MDFDLIRRNWRAFVKPPAPTPKSGDALKFGILGMSDTASMALIAPAKQHAEVAIEAVAADDLQTAERFAKRHGIPRACSSYQDLLNDPSINAVYISALAGDPNPGLEWALKALTAGKHVLLEPGGWCSVADTTQAKLVFHSPLAKDQEQAQHQVEDPEGLGPAGCVLLDALPYRFHPCWIAFGSLLRRPSIVSAEATVAVQMTAATNPFFSSSYSPSPSPSQSSSSTAADLTYQALSVLRAVFGADPDRCERWEQRSPRHVLHGSAWRFPNGGVGEARVCLQGGGGASVAGAGINTGAEPLVRVVVREEEVVGFEEGEERAEEMVVEEEVEKVARREVELRAYFCGPPLWNRVVVREEGMVRRKGSGKVVRRWKVEGVGEGERERRRKMKKGVYTLREAGIEGESEPHWTASRFLLEEFVNKVRRREGSGAWVGGEESVGLVRMVEMAYGM
ncbi:hypothetical protein VTK26DRAFT_386 [Humicola hyalothermophila]